MSSNKKEAWGSKIGVVLAVTGSAVGLGNFLRFPGKVVAYDGGAFMIPYFIALLLLGLPIAWLEWTMGRYGGSKGFNSYPGIFRQIWKHPIAPYLGVLGLLVPLAIYMYYVFIESWCLGYAWFFLTGSLDLGGDSKVYGDFFSNFIGAGSNGSLLHGGSPVLIFLGICIIANFYLIYRGLSKGIETFCLWAMPMLVVCAIIILIRVLTLGTPDPSKPELNVINALGFMWNPRSPDGNILNSLMNGKIWLEAASQIFFTLSVGFGVIINYASYLKKDDDVTLSGTTAVAGNEFCEVALGGMISVPAAFLFLGAAGAVGSTFGLGFNALPVVFHYMPWGNFFGFIFFFLLFLAAITSSLSMLQPVIAFIEEGLGWNRRKSVTVLAIMTMLGTSFVVYFSQGTKALDTMDFWAGSLCIFLLATVQVLLFVFAFGVDRGFEEMDRGSELRIPRFFKFVIKYVCPTYLVTVFAVWFYQNIGDQIKSFQTDFIYRLTVLVMVLIFAVLMVMAFYAVKRWKQLEKEQR